LIYPCQGHYATGRLNDFWTLEGILMGNTNFVLPYMIHAMMKGRDQSPNASFHSFVLGCRLDQDLKTLSLLFQEDMLELWPNRKPEVSAYPYDHC
jgi:hypothetical protein